MTVNKIDSNATGLRFAEEDSIGVLPVTPDWYPLEPNSYKDFGGQISTVARNPINDGRQLRKGVLTDLDASGGFTSDLTYDNLQRILQGFFFADFRTKAEITVADVDGTANEYQPTAGGDGYLAGDLLFAKGATNSANNGLKVVTGTPDADQVGVTDTSLVDESTASITISRVGFQFGSGDAEISNSGVPTLTSTTKDLTQLGLIPGEWIFIGGDQTSEKFTTAANNGFARVKSVAAHAIVFDKTAGTMVTDTGTGKTIRIFFGRVLKNETGTNIKRRTYQLERKLGAPDSAQPSQIQSEYLVGAVPNQLMIDVKTADKVTVDLSFIGIDHETRDGATGVKSGNRPALSTGAPFNTSSDFARIKMQIAGSPNPSPLFAFFTELSLTINNNVSPAKAVGELGAFEMVAGNFQVSGNVTGYFSDVAAVQAVRSNSNVTLDMHLVGINNGVSIDVPLITLGNGRLQVEQDKSIMIPMSADAASGADVDANQDHTLLMIFWDYLPNLAG
jgi:hypothetical protein